MIVLAMICVYSAYTWLFCHEEINAVKCKFFLHFSFTTIHLSPLIHSRLRLISYESLAKKFVVTG